MIDIDDETEADVAQREVLLDQAFGPPRFAKTCEIFRRGRLPAAGLSLVARSGRKVIGTVRLWHVFAGSEDHRLLLLGPLAVAQERRRAAIGDGLMRFALGRAAALGAGAVVLVGDPTFYGRFGFSADPASGLSLPGLWERHRLLGLSLRRNGFSDAVGLVCPAGTLC